VVVIRHSTASANAKLYSGSISVASGFVYYTFTTTGVIQF
jgi:hypothetical protein